MQLKLISGSLCVLLCICGISNAIVLEEVSRSVSVNFDYVLLTDDADADNSTVTCDENHLCLNGGTCVKERCQCLNKTGGDLCEIVDPVFCSFICADSDVSCLYDSLKQTPYCECKDPTTYFEYGNIGTECHKKCSPERPCLNNGVCVNERCECAYSTEGDLCEVASKTWCERFCGEHNVQCVYNISSHEPSCQCVDDTFYFDPQSKCTKKCNSSHPCQNGGTCVDSKCHCLEGSTGDYCKDPNCGHRCGKSPDVECVFNATAAKAICRCKDPTSFFDNFGTDPKCKKCECGENSTSCRWSEAGKKTCECDDGYAFDDRSFQDGCFHCMSYCDKNGNSRTCVISNDGVVSCVCKEGFKVETWNYQCEACDCGLYGNCSFVYSNWKRCACQEGYSDKDGTCTECDCGSHGKCNFYRGEKDCSCFKGFVEKDGKCHECNCGPESYRCHFDETGDKKCYCNDKKHYETEGRCEPCDCKLDVECSTAKNNTKMCHCPTGFEDKYGFCEDINECLNLKACPDNADCSNTNGSYTCECRLGYRDRNQDPKIGGCEDINECTDETQACFNDDTTTCLNTPGSYKCLCRKGFSPQRTRTYPKYNTCFVDQSGWRSATIVLGIGFSAMVLAALVFIGIRYRRYRS